MSQSLRKSGQFLSHPPDDHPEAGDRRNPFVNQVSFFVSFRSIIKPIIDVAIPS